MTSDEKGSVADVHILAGRYEEALVLLIDAHKECARSLGPEHLGEPCVPSIIVCVCGEGSCLHSKRNSVNKRPGAMLMMGSTFGVCVGV